MFNLKSMALFTICVFVLSMNANANDKFEKLKSLKGHWKAENSSAESFRITFESIANDTVLVETWYYDSKKRSLTLYHLDGDDILATHYCPQGNQPRMRHKTNTKSTVLSFEYQDATNLVSTDSSHQHSLSFTFINDENIKRTEVYMSKEGEDESSLDLTKIVDKLEL